MFSLDIIFISLTLLILSVVLIKIKSPKAIIGVCSSPGKFMEELDTTAKEIVSSVETYIKNIN